MGKFIALFLFLATAVTVFWIYLKAEQRAWIYGWLRRFVGPVVFAFLLAMGMVAVAFNFNMRIF